ncbi:MAG: hypothetical protein IPO91_12380 [Chloroflexi bacterium]|nr:hypothetical protein [Chloroflexota bacterium]
MYTAIRANLLRKLLLSAALTLFAVPALVLAQGITFEPVSTATLPWDAVPSPDGSTLYFTAIADDGCPAIFRADSENGAVTTLAACDPFVMPMGIAVSLDGRTLYVSDSFTAGAAGNAIFAVSTDSPDMVNTIAGTQGTAPQGVEVGLRNGVETLYFTGIHTLTGQPTVYALPTASGTPEVLAHGAPLVAPSGVAVSQDGSTVFVLDRFASGNGLGSVIRIRDGQATVLQSNVQTGGQLAGLTLTLDGSLLLVSSLDETAGTAQVLVLDLATQQSSVINDVISANTGAGGLHRAHELDVFAWADLTSGSLGGTIYRVLINR